MWESSRRCATCINFSASEIWKCNQLRELNSFGGSMPLFQCIRNNFKLETQTKISGKWIISDFNYLKIINASRRHVCSEFFEFAFATEIVWRHFICETQSKWTSNRKKNGRWLFRCLLVAGCRELSSKHVPNNDSLCRQPSHTSSRFQSFIQQWMQSPLLMGRERAFCACEKQCSQKNAHFPIWIYFIWSPDQPQHKRTHGRNKKSSWMACFGPLEIS